MQKRGGACNNQHTDPGRPCLHLQCPTGDPSQRLCSSAEPSQGHVLTRELCGVWICLIQILKGGVLLAPELSFSCPGKELNHSPTHYGECLLAPSAQKSWRQLLEAVQPSTTQAKIWAGRADSLQNKASSPSWSGSLGCGLA